MDKTQIILDWHNKLLDYLLDKHKQNPAFVFWLRQRDRNSRLSDGYWFQGNEGYIFLSFWNRGGGTNMTRSIGFVLGLKDDGSTSTSMEVAFNGEKDKDLIAMYQKIIARYKIEQQHETKYKIGFTEPDPFRSLDHFLTVIKPEIDQMVIAAGKQMIFIDPNDFNTALAKTLSLRAGQSVIQTKDEEAPTQYYPMTLNQIFFGPPGTGKTYHTTNEAVRITDPDYYEQNKNNRKALKERYQQLLITDWEKGGQIAFCTFHQSFSYEDFVEGIKPEVSEEDQVLYKVKDGVFKLICKLSQDSHTTTKLKTDRLISWDDETYGKASFYKISLGDSNKSEDNEIFEYCVKNNCIALGYGGLNDFSGLSEKDVTAKCKELGQSDYTAQAVNFFIHYIKNNNYVAVSYGLNHVRALAKVTGEYFYNPTSEIRYKHFRKVEWIFANQMIPIDSIYNRKLSQATIYKLDGAEIKKDFFVKGGQQVKAEMKQEKNFVLIIDEINRGNVSSIFGELITLIEKDKRAGETEEVTVTLPYSKEPFLVPANVYLVGTMNTADRSIEALDTALRRRFSFHEMLSNPEVLATEGLSKGKIGSIDLVQLLNTINQRIEKLIDKDHKIGHAYFMEDTTEESLRNTFHNKVIPLLQEYFFGDFGKIGLVLGNSFVVKINPEGFKFADFKEYGDDEGVQQDLKNRAVYKIRTQEEWDFKSIYA